MMLHSWECPDCGEWFSIVEAALRPDNLFVIRCPECLSIERFQRYGEAYAV